MITINSLSDINWETIQAVAYEGEKLAVSPALLGVVENGRLRFQQLIDQGIPCYGVTTGLGQLVTLDLSEDERQDLPHNILRARAAAIGPPLSRPIVRSLMIMRLVNFLSGLDGVRPELCTFLVDRLNDDFTPWVPSMGHGMGADAIAHTHAFQTFIGEGFVMNEAGERITAAEALAQRGVEPIRLGKKEGLALLNGISAAPAYAFDAHREAMALLKLATVISAVSCEGVAAPKDSFDCRLKEVSVEAGPDQILDWLQPLLCNSEIRPYKLQSAISYRVIPQLHGAMLDALNRFRGHIEAAVQTFSDNPLMVDDGFLSVGLFHNQHLVNQADQIALNIAHIGSLSVRRLHRLLSTQNTGLNPQLAARPGLDAGLVVAQKAALGIAARLKLLANPVSIMTEESSAGQEDYMSMAFPTIARLYEMVSLTKMILAYELLAGLTALNLRNERAGDGVTAVLKYFAPHIQPLNRDRPPGPDVELILELIQVDSFQTLVETALKQE